MKQAPEIKIPLATYYRLAINNPIELRTKIFSEYGDIAWRKLKGIVTYSMANPEYAKHILQDNQDNYLYKHPILHEIFGPLIGENGLFINNNLEQWYRDRVTADVSFDPKVYFQDYGNTITRLTLEMFDRWRVSYKEGQSIDVVTEFSVLVLSIIAETLLNEKMDMTHFLNTVIHTSDLVKRKAHTPGFLWIFSKYRRAYEKEKNFVRKVTCDVVAKKIDSGFQWDDLLGHFIHEYRNSSKKELIDILGYQVATFLAVGYFTTSALIQWILVELSNRPEVERQITQEVSEVLGDRVPTYADLPSLKYLSCVIKEVLRLHPTAFVMLKQAIDSDTMKGFFIPKGAGISISTYHLHRHPDYWINPDGFDPERFRNNPLGQSDPFAYLPFGSSKRKCPGSGFSTLEATLIIAMLVQRVRLFLPPNSDVKPFLTTIISMRPNISQMTLKYKN
jgi:cytochrome P450